MIRKVLAGLLLPVLMASSLSVPVYAAVKSDDVTIVAADEVIDDDLFAAGSEVIIEGTVNGDLYAFANRISVHGTINGDVIAAGNTIEIRGSVRDDLRLAGSSILLVGAVIGDSVSVAGNDAAIDSSTTIGGGLLFGGSSLSLDGSVGRGIMAGGQSARLDGPVGKTVRIAAEAVTIGSEAIIDGNLEYSSEVEATINGTVNGQVIYTESDTSFDTQSFLRALTIGFSLWAFAGAALVALVLVLLFPAIWRRADAKLAARPLMTAAYGSIVLLLTLPIVVLLAVTFIGIPLALVVLLLWILAVYIAKFFTAYAVGSRLLTLAGSREPINSSGKAYLAILIGLILYYLIRIVPGIGLLVRFLTSIVGLGMMLSLYHRERPSKTTLKSKKKEG